MNKVLCSYMNFYSFNREYKFLEKPEPPGISAHEDSEIVLQKYIWSFDLKKRPLCSHSVCTNTCNLVAGHY